MIKLKYKISVYLSAAVVLLLLGTLQVANKVIQAQSDVAIKENLEKTARVFEGLREERTAGLLRQIQVLAESPQVKAAIQVQDPATVADLVEELLASSGLDLFQAVGRKGSLLAWGVNGEVSEGKKPDKAAVPEDEYFKASVNPENPLARLGTLGMGDELFLTVTGPVIIKDQVLGAIRVGFKLNEDVAKTLREQTGTDAAFMSSTGRIFASSLSSANAVELELNLKQLGLTMAELGKDSFEVNLGGIPHVGQVIHLLDPDGKPVGHQVQLKSRDEVLALLGEIQSGFLFILLAGMVAAILFSFAIAGGVTKPLDQLIEATHAVEDGNYDFKLKIKSKDELGLLAASFNEMIGDLKEKERVKALFGKFLPKAVAEKALAHQGDIKLGGDMLEVTTLFSDIRGFTAMSEKMSPQEVISMLNDYYTRMIDVLFKHDGTLDKTIGDAVMALFGAPVPDDQGPVKSVRTGLGMMAELNVFNEERKAKGLHPIEIGIGINTGQVVAGNLGSIKQFSYTVIGEEVNLASRLCSNAGAGQVLISESTYRAVKWQFEVNKLEPITVKNVSQPVQVYEVLGEKMNTTPPDMQGGQ